MTCTGLKGECEAGGSRRASGECRAAHNVGMDWGEVRSVVRIRRGAPKNRNKKRVTEGAHTDGCARIKVQAEEGGEIAQKE
jgi:hypothetical protein